MKINKPNSLKIINIEEIQQEYNEYYLKLEFSFQKENFTINMCYRSLIKNINIEKVLNSILNKNNINKLKSDNNISLTYKEFEDVYIELIEFNENSVTKKWVNVLRYVTVVPVTFLLVTILYKLLGYTAINMLDFDNLFIWLFTFGGIVIFVANMISIMFSAIINLISPNKKFSSWVISILGVLSAINMIYKVWSLPLEYNGDLRLIAIGYSIISIYITYTLIITPKIIEN